MTVFVNAARRMLRESYRQWHLLANSGALAIGAAATAVLGFMFWWFAAHHFPAHSVGLAAAAISIMNLIGLVGEFGLGTLLMGESLRRGKEAAGLISAALFAALGSSTLFGVACLVFVNLSPLKFGSFLDSADHSLLFIGGCAITGFALALDCALIAVLQSALQMYRNVAFSILKLALLPALVFIVPDTPQVVTIFLAWVLGKLLSILLLVSFLAYGGHSVWRAPNFAALGRHAPNVLGHHLLNLVTQGPGLLLPFLVTVVFAADVNAAFYAAWMIFGVILLVPASLTTMLFTMGSVEPAAIAARMRFSLWLCALVSLVAGLVFIFLSGWILLWFGESYATIGEPILQSLGLGVFAVVLKYHYIAVQRLNGRMVRAAVLIGAGGVAELTFAVYGSHLGGLSGFTWGWLCAVYLEAAFVMPSVLRAARSAGFMQDPHDVPPRAALLIPFESHRSSKRGASFPLKRRTRALILGRRR